MSNGIVKRTRAKNRGANVPSLFEDLFSPVFERFDELWDSPFTNRSIFSDLQSGSFPKMNVIEDEKQYKVDFVIAPFNKDDVDIEFDENILYLKANTKREEKSEDENFIHREIKTSSFRRPVKFDKKIDPNKIDCSYNDGVIKITLPKVDNDTGGPKKIKVR